MMKASKPNEISGLRSVYGLFPNNPFHGAAPADTRSSCVHSVTHSTSIPGAPVKSNLALFDDYQIRRLYDGASETWYFSVVDIIRVLIRQPDFQAARNYWKVLKNRLSKEGSQTVTKCNRLNFVR
jgi:hypothetical protein